MSLPWSVGVLVVTKLLLVIMSRDAHAMPARQGLEQPRDAGTGGGSVAGLLGLIPDSSRGLVNPRFKRSLEESARPVPSNAYDRIKSITHLMKSLGPDEARKVISALSVIRDFLLKQKSVIASSPGGATEEVAPPPWSAQSRPRQQRNYQRAYPEFKEEVRRMGPEFNPTGW